MSLFSFKANKKIDDFNQNSLFLLNPIIVYGKTLNPWRLMDGEESFDLIEETKGNLAEILVFEKGK